MMDNVRKLERKRWAEKDEKLLEVKKPSFLEEAAKTKELLEKATNESSLSENPEFFERAQKKKAELIKGLENALSQLAELTNESVEVLTERLKQEGTLSREAIRILEEEMEEEEMNETKRVFDQKEEVAKINAETAAELEAQTEETPMITDEAELKAEAEVEAKAKTEAEDDGEKLVVECLIHQEDETERKAATNWIQAGEVSEDNFPPKYHILDSFGDPIEIGAPEKPGVVMSALVETLKAAMVKSNKFEDDHAAMRAMWEVLAGNKEIRGIAKVHLITDGHRQITDLSGLTSQKPVKIARSLLAMAYESLEAERTAETIAEVTIATKDGRYHYFSPTDECGLEELLTFLVGSLNFRKTFSDCD